MRKRLMALGISFYILIYSYTIYPKFSSEIPQVFSEYIFRKYFFGKFEKLSVF